MARPLNPTQAAALERVIAQRKRLKVEKPLVRARIKAAIEREIRDLELALALAVRDANRSGISLRRIGLEGLKTTDPGTPKKWLEKTAGLEDVTVEIPEPFFERADGVVEISIVGYDTAAPSSAEDYPAVLKGEVRHNGEAWEVVTDPGDTQVDTGVLPGWLTWEIQRPASAEKSLVAMLNEWSGR